MCSVRSRLFVGTGALKEILEFLDADVDVPDLTLQNAYAKREARRLLDSADEYF